MQEVLSREAPQSAQGQGPHALPRLRLRPSRLRLPLAALVSAASGLLLSAALPPADIGPLAFVAPVPFVWLVREARPRRGLLLGFVFGFAYFGVVLCWVFLFGLVAWTALVTASAAFMAVFGALAPVVWRAEHPYRSAVGMAGLWTGIEWLRGMWPLGGFAWGQLGSTQTGNPFLLRLASVTGVWGISFVVLLAGTLALLAAERATSRRASALGLTAVALAIVLLPGAIPILQPDGRTLVVAAIQVDVLRAASLDPVQEDIRVAELNVAQQGTLVRDPPDLIVWGEGALDPGAYTDPATMATVRASITQVGSPTLAGAVTRPSSGIERTEALLFDGEGRLVDRYAKVHLVPFGEYVPWRRQLQWISALEQIPVDRQPGERIHTVAAGGLPAFGTPICFENSFPGIEREMVRQGAGFFVLTINNASYRYTAASQQHLVMSRLRAVEDARWVVHAAVSGVSAFVDPSGRVVGETELFATDVLRQQIRTSTRETPYVRFGDWLPALSLLLAVGLLAAPRTGRHRGASAEPLPNRPRALVILPTYNERETIEQVIDGLLALPEDLDILVVDDSSPDGTGGLVRALSARDGRVRLLERPAKAGLASAYLQGFRTGIDERYDLLIEMDSDLSHRPDQLPSLLAAAVDHDLVIGSRYVPGGSVSNWSRPRVALSKAGNLYARLMLGFPVQDATSGFRVFRTDLLTAILHDPVRSDGYGFQIELALRAWKAGARLAESPITFQERAHGRSKISRRIVLEALWLVTIWGVRARLRGSQ
ncbi:MAG: apolipoprotein N-acyltransferase [Actinomycetota bacterium]